MSSERKGLDKLAPTYSDSIARLVALKCSFYLVTFGVKVPSYLMAASAFKVCYHPLYSLLVSYASYCIRFQ